MASKQQMIDQAAERLIKGKKAAVRNRKKRILRRGHKLGGTDER